MIHGQNRIAIPPNAEYSVPQLWMMIREVEGILDCDIAVNEWNKLR